MFAIFFAKFELSRFLPILGQNLLILAKETPEFFDKIKAADFTLNQSGPRQFTKSTFSGSTPFLLNMVLSACLRRKGGNSQVVSQDKEKGGLSLRGSAVMTETAITAKTLTVAS